MMITTIIVWDMIVTNLIMTKVTAKMFSKGSPVIDLSLPEVYEI